jgi:hypothetical protein
MFRWTLILSLVLGACHKHTTDPTPDTVKGPPATLDPVPDRR